MKKFISRMLILSVLVSSFGLSAAAEDSANTAIGISVEGSGEVFSDLDVEHENFSAIEYLKKNNVVEGYADGEFKAENKINRAEFLKIVMEASEYDLGGENCYKDVKKEWFAKYVCAATEAGLVKGYDDGTFKPGKEINFAEASKIIANTLELEKPKGDEDDFAYWYQPYVISLELWNAVPTSIASFSQEISRGEMSEMIYRVDNADALGYMESKTFRDIHNGVLLAASNGGFDTFESCAELSDYVELNSGAYFENYSGLTRKGFEVEPMPGIAEDDFVMTQEPQVNEGAADESVDSVRAVGEAAESASSTNVQVKGVDEADIVKNDLEYIYTIQDFKVQIIKAYPADELGLVSELTFGDSEFYPTEMYVDGDRLIVVGEVYGSVYDIMPIELEEDSAGDTDESIAKISMPSSGPTTKVFVVDISDRSEPEIMRSLSFEGNYNDSRKVDDTVYLVMQKNEYYYDFREEMPEDELLPLEYDSFDGEIEPIAACGDIRYRPGVDETNYLILAAIPVDEADAEVDKEVILGSSGDVYSSRENLYVAESNYRWGIWEGGNSGLDEETVVHRFALDDGEIEYDAQGEVPGTILNQFSMDEDGDYFRLATTTGSTWDGSSKNNVFVLNKDLELVGSLIGIAPGEDIYSVRFMGDRAYMVTFLQIDPFFVIDLSNPANPAVLGELKIPGYSNYLHPFSEDLIIGIGKDAIASDEDWWGTPLAWYQGMKMAMFDVSDVKNPKELHTVTIGDRGTGSEVLHNHKALLFDKEMGLMAFPVSVYELPDEVKESSQEGWEHGDFVWQGAYVYDVSEEDGFQLRGKVTHYSEDVPVTEVPYYYYGYNNIKRVLYIGDILYTVSFSNVKANELDTLDEVNSVILPAG